MDSPKLSCELRGYQKQALEDARRLVAAGYRRILLQAATGSG